MARVSRSAILLIQPSNSAITRLAVKFGISLKIEEAGNYLYRLSKTELRSLFESLGMHFSVFKRNFMYYHHKPTKVYYLFEKSIFLTLFTFFFHLLNFLLGQFGTLYTISLNSGESLIWSPIQLNLPSRRRSVFLRQPSIALS